MGFTVSLSTPSGKTVSVDYATADGTATAGADYESTSGTVTIPAGATSATVTVSIAGDAIDEEDETLSLLLSNPTNATIADGVGVGTLRDDDPPPTVSVGDATDFEGDGEARDLIFSVRLARESAKTITVDYRTVDETARAGEDFAATTGSLTFLPGETGKTVAVPIIGDERGEFDETFRLELSNAANATVGDGTGTGTIRNDDPAITISDGFAREGADQVATFFVNISPPSEETVTVSFGTQDFDARAGLDYVPASGTLVFEPGEKQQLIQVHIVDDIQAESTEFFIVQLDASSAAGATVVDDVGIGTIFDNDSAGPPGLFINDAGAGEGDAMLFHVQMTEPSSHIVTVNYATGGGTATAGADYLPASGTLVFPPGSTLQTIIVQTLEDDVCEGFFAEFFFVSLFAPVNAEIERADGMGSIFEDEDCK